MKSHNYKTGFRPGFTLVEMLVAITVLGILSGAIAAVMVAQLRSATSQQGIATVQSDVNLAMTIMRWDMAQAGFGRASYVDTVIRSTPPAGQGDNITLAGAIIASTETQRWSVVMPASGLILASDEVMVYRWTDPHSDCNLMVGDSIYVLSSLKQEVGRARITAVVDSSSNSTITYRLDRSLGMLPGSVIFTTRYQSGGTASLENVARYTYDPTSRTLLRNGLPFLENVEQFQVRYFFDQNDDRVLDTIAEFQDVFFTTVDPARWNFAPFLIGITLVTSPPMTEARVVDPRATVDIWDSSYPLTPVMQRRYRNVHTLLVRPRNIGG